jgi:hypothetical protein
MGDEGMSRRLLVGLAIVGLHIIGARPLLAGTSADIPFPKTSVYLGGYLLTASTDVRIGLGGIGTGLDINLEDALNLTSTSQVFRTGAYHHFGESRRHRVDIDWLALRRSSSKVLNRDITVGDNTVLPAGTTAEAVFNFDIIRTSYAYSILLDDRIDLALGGGFYVMPVEMGLTTITGSGSTQSVTAPLPVLSLIGRVALGGNFFLKENLDLFYFKYKSFEGGLADATIGVEYNRWKNFGLGAALENQRISVSASGGDVPAIDFVGSFDFRITGLSLYGTYNR